MRVFQVDAFTDRPFSGNAAAVCLCTGAVAEPWMQAVAAEMALSETAFLWPERDGRRALRWFTPVTEVDLCGHATLAAAHVLDELGAPRSTLRFDTRSGLLGARVSADGMIWLDLPAWAPRPAPLGDDLAAALGAAVGWAGQAGPDLLVELADEAAVLALAPDLAALRRADVRALVVTARGGPGGEVDFVSRVFAPGVGIDEDPVTGSAHCALGPYWAARIPAADRVDPPRLRAAQRSARGGRLVLSVEGDRVQVGGRAVTVLRGELADPA